MTGPAGGRVTYAVPWWLVGVMAAGSLGALRLTLSNPMPGRLLFAVVAVGAAFEAARSALLRPVVSADSEGVEVVVGLRRERHPWSSVTAVGTLQPRGSAPRRRANALEVDLGQRLLLVPAYRLGAAPADVAETLGTLRESAGGLSAR